jgi:hypothetical protein
MKMNTPKCHYLLGFGVLLFFTVYSVPISNFLCSVFNLDSEQ